ncbi:MAG: D-alanyl-D-alanine carboxypeptidase family protein [Actinomycetota bacterium]
MNLSTRRLIAATLLALCWVAPAAPGTTAGRRPTLSCEACIVVDDTGRTLFARRAGRPLAIASTTKMMTALLADAALARDERVTVSPTAAATGGGGLDLEAGESYPVDTLLKALLMTSSNDAAVALAEAVAGTEAAFVRAMNRRAAELGARGTMFVTAHGLDRPGHVSTARDLARIAAELLSDPELAAIAAAPSTTAAGPEGSILLENRNLLLESYPGAIGVKTGYTAEAGNVLVAAARRHGRRVITVALGSDDSFADSTALLDLGFARLRRGLVLRAGRPVGALVFAAGGASPIVAAETVRGIVRPDRVEVSVAATSGAAALPLAPGDRVGTIVLSTRSGRVIAEVAAVAAAPVDAPSGGWLAGLLGGLLRGAWQVAG